MRIFSVYEPPAGVAGVEARARTRFVREGFSWLALLFPLPWLLFKGMWIVLALYLAVAIAAEAAARLVGLPQGVAALVVTVVFAFEARNLYGWTLSRRGWRFCGVVAAGDGEEAARRWFDAHPVAMPWSSPAGDERREPAPPAGAVPAGASIFPDTRPVR